MPFFFSNKNKSYNKTFQQGRRGCNIRLRKSIFQAHHRQSVLTCPIYYECEYFWFAASFKGQLFFFLDNIKKVRRLLCCNITEMKTCDSSFNHGKQDMLMIQEFKTKFPITLTGDLLILLLSEFCMA